MQGEALGNGPPGWGTLGGFGFAFDGKCRLGLVLIFGVVGDVLLRERAPRLRFMHTWACGTWGSLHALYWDLWGALGPHSFN